MDPKYGVFNGVRTNIWARVGGGGKNIVLNALYYSVLNLMAQLSDTLATGDMTNGSRWRAMAQKLKESATLPTNVLWRLA